MTLDDHSTRGEAISLTLGITNCSKGMNANNDKSAMAVFDYICIVLAVQSIWLVIRDPVKCRIALVPHYLKANKQFACTVESLNTNWNVTVCGIF